MALYLAIQVSSALLRPPPIINYQYRSPHAQLHSSFSYQLLFSWLFIPSLSMLQFPRKTSPYYGDQPDAVRLARKRKMEVQTDTRDSLLQCLIVGDGHARQGPRKRDGGARRRIEVWQHSLPHHGSPNEPMHLHV